MSQRKAPTYTNMWAIPAHMADSILRTIYAPPPGAQAPAPKALSDPQNSVLSSYTVQDGVAVISISGVITKSPEYSMWTGLPITQGLDAVSSAMQAALQDASVHAILFSIDSPGGEIGGTKELSDAIAAAAKVKRCAAYADGFCASAAFWLAASTGRILAPVTAMVGSVGVIMTHVDWSKAYDQFGITVTNVTAGKWKDAGWDNHALSKEEHAYFQKRMDDFHAIFKADVQARMGITAPEADWAEAQLYLAGEAIKHGMVSAIVQDLPEAIATLAKETIMDKNILKAQHPDVYEQIAAEGRIEAEAAAAATVGATMAVVRVSCGDAAADSVQAVLDTCVKSGLTPVQMQALAPALAKPVAAAAALAQASASPATAQSAAQQSASQADAPHAATPEATAMQNILAGIQASAAKPLAADPKAAPAASAESPLVADADARSKSAQQSRM